MQPPLVIDPDAVYEEGTISLTLDVRLATLARARWNGELKFVRRGNRIFILGRHLLSWLDPDQAGAVQEGR
jgi:hypothetical protein